MCCLTSGNKGKNCVTQPEAPALLTRLPLPPPQIMADSSSCSSRSTFAVMVGLSQILGLGSVVLIGVWMGHYHGGFAWDGSAYQFNVHPLCMVLGLVFLQGDGKSTVRVSAAP